MLLAAVRVQAPKPVALQHPLPSAVQPWHRDDADLVPTNRAAEVREGEVSGEAHHPSPPASRTRPRFRATPKTSNPDPTRTPGAPHNRDRLPGGFLAATVGDPRRGVATAHRSSSRGGKQRGSGSDGAGCLMPITEEEGKTGLWRCRACARGGWGLMF